LEDDMAEMIKVGKELIRIDPKNDKKLQYSTNDGRTWSTHYSSTSCGEFSDLVDNDKEILAHTSKGLYYSKNSGRTWSKRS
jgi:hypothetical protein